MKSFSTLSNCNAAAIVDGFFDAFQEHVSIRRDGDICFLPLRYGLATLTATGDRIEFSAEADDDIRLSYVKMAVAEHLAAHPLTSTEKIEWTGALDAAPPFFQTIEVVSSRMVTPHMKRITFRSDSFGSYAAGGIHVRLIFPPTGRQPVWPSLGADGRIQWPSGADALAARVYTIRSIDLEANEIEIDFVLHDHMDGVVAPGADFGASAVPGQVVGIFAPGGDEIPKAPSLLLFADETGLPAMARILEEQPATSRVLAFAEVDSPHDHYDFPSAPNIELTYLYRHGRKPGTVGLLPEAMRQLTTPCQVSTYLWAGCAFDDYMEIRRVARKDWQLARENHSVVAYWRNQ